ncbi:MAG TPA: PepSY-like domain-containing protein [Niastella sp.]
MKKLMLFFCATLLSSGITFAQHKSVKKTKRETTAKALVAPAPVKDAFGQNFADVSDAKWSKSVTGNWTANFQRDSVKTAVEYTADGNWVATRSEYTGDRLPETIATTLKTKYPAATVKDGWRIERANVAAYYKVNIQDNGTEKSVLINEAGTITE